MKPLVGCFAVLMAAGCATTPAASDASDVEATAGSDSVATAEPTAPAAAAEAPSPSPMTDAATMGTGEAAPTTAPPTTAPPVATSTAPRAAGDRTGDGIDDENWLPRADTPAFAAFQAAVELARKDPAAAVDAFVGAARKTEGFYAAWFDAGAAAEIAGRTAEAEGHYRKSLEARGDYGLALTNLAALLMRSGREAEASQLIADAERRFPEKAGPHLAAAQHALDRSDLVAAEASARAAMKYDERNVPAMFVMARIFHAQGRLDTARFAVDNALALEPGNALLHLERGRILLAQQEKKDALVAFERAARLRPSLAEAQEAYGLALLDQGFAPEAEAAFNALVRLEPKQAAAQLHLGNALRANKKYPEAEKAYRAALGLDANLFDARFNLGLLYIDNPLPGVDEIQRLERAGEELKQFRDGAKPDGALKKRVDDYVESTEKRIAKERKRREREEKRKAEDAKKAAEPAQDAAPSGDAAKAAAPEAAAPPAEASPMGTSPMGTSPAPTASSPSAATSPAAPAAASAAAEGGTDDK